jgi:hypothetical protein
MEVGFTGSREYPRPDLVENFVRALARKYPDVTVVSGGRGNVDETAERVAEECGLQIRSYRPAEGGIWACQYIPGKGWSQNWVDGYPTFVQNCFLRNSAIARSDKVAAFWDLLSHGSADTISKARGQKVELFVYGPDGTQLTSIQTIEQLAKVLG